MRISDWSSDVCSSDLALLDCPADKAFFGAEVENIIAIYPRRKDDDWRFQHVLCHRLILNELIQRRFLDDLARRGCDIDADLERVAVGMGELSAIEVREHVLKPAQQVLATCFLYFLQNQRIGQREIARSDEHTSELQSLMRTSYAVFCLK